MASEPTRHDWLRLGGLTIRGLLAGGADASAWWQAGRVLARVNPPTFPSRTFDIVKYGAVKGGTANCTDAIRQAAKACNAAGGGHDDVPASRGIAGLGG